MPEKLSSTTNEPIVEHTELPDKSQHSPEAPPATTHEESEENPSTAIDAEPDAEIRHTDAELLGRRYPIRQVIRAAGNQRMRLVESTQATWKNTLSTPKKMRLGLRTSLAEGRVARHTARVDAVKEGTWLYRRRLAKLEKVTAKRDRIKNNYDTVVDEMSDRRNAVKDNFENRKNEYTKNLKDRAELARARKSLRHELKDQGAGLAERRSIVHEMIKKHPTVIVEALGDTSSIVTLKERELRQAERTEKRARTSHNTTLDALTINAQLSKESAVRLEDATNKKKVLSEGIMTHTEAVTSLREQRDQLDEEDPQSFLLGIELRQAERSLSELKEKYNELSQIVDQNSAQIANLADEKTRLDARREATQDTYKIASDEITKRKELVETAQQAQQTAVRSALSTTRLTKEKK